MQNLLNSLKAINLGVEVLSRWDTTISTGIVIPQMQILIVN